MNTDELIACTIKEKWEKENSFWIASVDMFFLSCINMQVWWKKKSLTFLSVSEYCAFARPCHPFSIRILYLSCNILFYKCLEKILEYYGSQYSNCYIDCFGISLDNLLIKLFPFSCGPLIFFRILVLMANWWSTTLVLWHGANPEWWLQVTKAPYCEYIVYFQKFGTCI